MAGREVSIILSIVDKASSELEKVKGKVEGLTTEAKGASSGFSDLGKSISSVVTKLGTLAAGVVSISKLKDFAVSSVNAWVEEEKSIVRLNSVVKALYQNYQEVGAYFEKLSGYLQETILVSDSEARSLIALASSLGVSGAQVQRLIEVSKGLSVAFGMDLQSAMLMVVRAGEGFNLGLRRYGINLDENRLKTEGLSYVLDELGQRFSLSREYFNTSGAALESLRLTYDDFKETIGKTIVENLKLTEITGALRVVLKDLQDEGSGVASVFKAVSSIISYVVKGVIVLISALTNLFDIIGKSLGALAASISFVFKGKLKEAGEAVKGLLDDITKAGLGLSELFNKLGLIHGESYSAGFKAGVLEVPKFIEKVSKEASVQAVNTLNNILNTVKAKISKFDVKLRIRTETDFDFIEDADELIKRIEYMNEKYKTLTNTVHSFASTVVNAFEAGIRSGQSFDAILQNLIEDLIVYFVKAVAISLITYAITSALGVSVPGGFNTLLLSNLGVPAFQYGGYVKKPTLALVGEREPEYIVPESKINAFGNIRVEVYNATPSTYVKIFRGFSLNERKYILNTLRGFNV